MTKSKNELKDAGKRTEKEPEIEETPWRSMAPMEKAKTVLFTYALKIVLLFCLLYFFICSLGLLGDSFQLVGGKAAGQVFQDSEVLRNPVAGLMIGVLATVLLQSSSTTTSIIVGLVAGRVIPVSNAIPMVMGANIGTSMTNTIVSMGQSGNRDEFRRAFAGATIHDMFNWLCVIIFLPLEVASGLLEFLSRTMVGWISGGSSTPDIKLLKVITDPFTKMIIQLDDDKIQELATTNKTSAEIGSLIIKCGENNISECSLGDKAFHLFAHTSWSDTAVGAVMLVVSLVMLIGCLVLIVKLLNRLLTGHVAKIIKKSVNSKLPGVFKHLTGYFVMLIGAGMTILVQSSSVFTSALTPLVGIGILELERMYPLTLGSNLGTTFTSLLAALSANPKVLKDTLQIAFVHLFFNILGILVFYPLPFMRKVPIGLAKLLGEKTSKYRWFAGLYLLTMFFALPVAVFGLSLAGPVYLFSIGGVFAAFISVVILINVLQVKAPRVLPPVVRSWAFLPAPLHSLAPYDRWVTRGLGALARLCPCCCRQLLSASARGRRGDTVSPGDTPFVVTAPSSSDAATKDERRANGATPNGVKIDRNAAVDEGTTVLEHRF